MVIVAWVGHCERKQWGGIAEESSIFSAIGSTILNGGTGRRECGQGGDQSKFSVKVTATMHFGVTISISYAIYSNWYC